MDYFLLVFISSRSNSYNEVRKGNQSKKRQKDNKINKYSGTKRGKH